VLAVLFIFDLGSVVLRQFVQSHPGITGLCHGKVRLLSRDSLIFIAGDQNIDHDCCML
jgi:hypothetical protein